MSRSAVVALSPYSKLGPDTVLIGANCLDASVVSEPPAAPRIINPYPDFASVARASEYCWELGLKTVARLGERLGEIHGEPQSAAYWEALLLPWMAAWIENLYDRYLRLKLVRDTMPGARLEAFRTAPPPVLYERSFEVWSRSHLHSANARVYALLTEAMGLSGSVDWVEGAADGAQAPAPTKPGQKIKEFVFRHTRSIVDPDPFREAGLAWREPVEDALKDKGFARAALDRRRLRLEAASDEFETLLGALMPRALPLSLFEEYQARRAYASGLRKRKEFQAVCISAAFWPSDSLKYLLADLRISGGRVAGHQHGAGYGCFALNTPERVERRLTDFFISWGWEDDGERPAVPLPEPRLAALADKHRKSNDDILFVGSQGPMYMFRYQSYWIPEFVWSRYFPMQEIFFRAIPENLKAALVYKPYHADYGWGERGRVSSVLPRVRFDEQAGAVRGMKRAKLVVIDHPGTSLLQAFALNVPTVAFWDPAQIPMRREAKPYFDVLREEGILHDGPEPAARKVVEIERDPRGWWGSAAVQSARERFCRRFAWSDPGWKALWREKLA